MGAIIIPSPPPPPSPPPSAAPLVTRLEYDGRFSRIFRLWLGNLLLFFVTLSFYRFWGRTRMRQYVWSHVTIFGDRLEYLGTGKELCIGFLLTIPLFLALGAVSEFFDIGAVTWIPILFIGYFAVYSGLRYRVSRTSWRAIRGYMPIEGFNPYTTLCFKRAFINFITLGIAVPKSDLLKWQFLVQHIQLGTVRAQFSFTTKGTMIPHIVSSLIGIALLGVVIVFGLGFAKPLLEKSLENKTELYEALIGVATLVIILALPFYFFIRQWYTAVLVRKKFSGIRIGSVALSYHCGAWRFMGFKFVNMLILFCTLGLGGAFILHRKARFFAKHLQFHGTLDEAMVAQMHGAGVNRFAEGFMDTFGVDFGILS